MLKSSVNTIQKKSAVALMVWLRPYGIGKLVSSL